MTASIDQAYKLTCTCGHDFKQHIGNPEGFACKVREEHCMCKFFHLAK